MKKPTQAELEAFEAELDLLCQKHGVVLSHEDSQGAGIVRRPRLYLAEPCGCDIYLIAGETPDYE